MASYSLREPRSFTLPPTKVPAIPESRELPINRQARQLTAQDHQAMETHQPAGKVRYSWLCGLNYCPETDATANDYQDDTPSTTLMDAVDIVQHENNEEEMPVAAPSSSTALLDAVDSDDDKDDEPVEAPSQLSLHDVVTAMELDNEEQPDEQTSRPQLDISGAALDLLPVDLTHLSDSDSSSSSEEESDFDSDETESDEEFEGKCTSTAAPVSSWGGDNLSMDQVDNLIRVNMADVEAKKPWRFVFRCLVIPFDFRRSRDPFDIFFMRWDEFWRVHGRAVWERDFWQPLKPRSTEYYRRKWRQTRAQRAFRELGADLVERLGEEYPQALAKSLQEGWWYRIEPFPLRRLFLKNRVLYAEYLETRVKDRWPRGRNFLMKRGLKPLWWLPESSQSTASNGL